MNKRYKGTDIGSYRRMLSILWTENVGNDKFLDKIKTKWTLIVNIRKKHLIFLGYMMLEKAWKI